MLVMRSEKTCRRAKELANHGRQSTRDDYWHESLGNNYRMPEVCASLVLDQFGELESRVRSKIGVFERYKALFASQPQLEAMKSRPDCLHTRWLTAFRLKEASKDGETVSRLLEVLNLDGISSRPVWTPLQQQPVFRSCRTYGGEMASILNRTAFLLPSSTRLSESDQDKVVASVKRFVGL